MLKLIEGIYREGRIELSEVPMDVSESKVIVTLLDSSGRIDLRSRGINEEAAADLRHRLATVAEEWDRPEMDGYDAS